MATVQNRGLSCSSTGFIPSFVSQVRKLKQALNKRKKEADAKEQQQRKEKEKAKQAKEETEREEVR